MGKGSKKDKKPLPPKEPPKVAYFLFRDEVYEKMEKEHGGMNRGDLAELISEKWDKLDKAAKLGYE